ncbi:MAG TPA: IscS subfamily cysteine desulfurase [Alphaproteobacteria bacterium]|nr:IscS subfamily cysteine desulfurase [Alphaproteobacteria bacterium]
MTEKVAQGRSNRPKLPVYLDYQATTPVDSRVLAAMVPYFTEKFGNPSSTSYSLGREAALAVEYARAQLAEIIGADPREIVFTSGATESNNLAIKGVANFAHETRRHIIAATTEHKCVLESCRSLEEKGFRVSYLPVGRNGLIDLQRLDDEIGDDTLLVSIMAVNNEIGVIQPLTEIGALCRAKGVYFHSDAAQAIGRIPIDVDAMAVDLLSISGHKIYGPKGIGALYVRRRPRVRLEPLLSGGGQERGLRSGTLPAPLCVGIGVAAALASAEMADEAVRLRDLRDRLYSGLKERIPDLLVNGDERRRIAGNLNVAFPGIGADKLIENLPDLAVSTGSACTSTSVEPSYVLRAMGLDDALAGASLRFGLGRFTQAAEIDYATQAIADAVERLRLGTAEIPARERMKDR